MELSKLPMFISSLRAGIITEIDDGGEG